MIYMVLVYNVLYSRNSFMVCTVFLNMFLMILLSCFLKWNTALWWIHGLF